MVTTLIFGQTTEPEKVNVWRLIWATVVPILIGIYEVVKRIIPSVADHTIIGKVLDILTWLSDFFNRGVKMKKLDGSVKQIK